MQRAKAFLFVCAGLFLLAGLSAPAEAITMHLPGYSAVSLVALPNSHFSPSDIEIDGAGNLYIPTQTDGIRKVTPSGVVSLWSTAPAIDMTLLPSGDGYGAGRALCHCIMALSADGSYSPLFSDGNGWLTVELAPNGTLYATVDSTGPSGPGKGLYRIDRVTGAPTLVVSGGPGPGGSGTYWDMAWGSDDHLYILGTDAAGHWLLRLDVDHFTRVVALPHGCVGLAVDVQGTIYGAASAGEVWVIDVEAGTATLLASGLSLPLGIAFDNGSGKLYVSEQQGTRQVWAITKDSATPTQRESFGAMKSRYRRERAAQPDR